MQCVYKVELCRCMKTSWGPFLTLFFLFVAFHFWKWAQFVLGLSVWKKISEGAQFHCLTRVPESHNTPMQVTAQQMLIVLSWLINTGNPNTVFMSFFVHLKQTRNWRGQLDRILNSTSNCLLQNFLEFRNKSVLTSLNLSSLYKIEVSSSSLTKFTELSIIARWALTIVSGAVIRIWQTLGTIGTLVVVTCDDTCMKGSVKIVCFNRYHIVFLKHVQYSFSP